MILYINDFYVDRIEAVSNQMAMLAKKNNGVILAATRFLGQKPLRIRDIKERKVILPPWLYLVVMPFFIFMSKKIHLFTEERSLYKRILINLLPKPVFVSIYRRPDKKLIADLKKYKTIKKIFVELDGHRAIFLRAGFPEETVKVIATPSLFEPVRYFKMFNPAEVKILFASWNNSEGNPLYDRGLLFLKDLLLRNDNFKLTICMRGNDDGGYREVLRSANVLDRVAFENPKDIHSLRALFDNADFVAFIPQKRISKDVPNSIIDGFMFGKPAMASKQLDLADTIIANNLGLVFEEGQASAIQLSSQVYADMQKSVLENRDRHKKSEYIDGTTLYYDSI